MKYLILGIVIVTNMLIINIAYAEVHVINQKDREFIISDTAKPASKLTIKKGDSVEFANLDPYFHNVFSLSDSKVFDLGSYPKGEKKSIAFDDIGTIEVECAIHPNMHMLIEVTE